MKRIGLFIGFLALLIFVLPSLTAQDEKKKDDAKVEKKDHVKKDEKKDEIKKDEKKDPEKKDEEKKKIEPKKVEKEKLVYGSMFRTKIVSANADNSREFTIEVQEIDPKKVYDMNVWVAQRSQQLTQDLFSAQRQKGAQYQQALFNYNKNMAAFGMEKMKRAAGVYTAKNVEVKAAENAKVRSLGLPVEFDDNGFQKKWTRKEIDEKRDKTGLPGFPSDFDALKSGQYIDIYMAKPAAKVPAKKKGPDDDDLPAMKRQEYVMIVIVSEPMQK